MIDKLKEVLGLLSGYKAKYDGATKEIEESKNVIEAQKKMLDEGEHLTDQILDLVKNLDVNK